MTNKEFARLIDKLQKKDIKALKTIYEQYFQKIYNTAYGILKNKDNAYDVAMNVIMKLIEYPANPYLIDNHIGLLIFMTKNESVDFIRKNKRQLNEFSEENEFKRYSSGKRTIAIPKKVFVPVIACMGCFIIFLTVTLSILLTKGKNDFDMTFGDESVYSAVMSDDALQKITDKFTFIKKMQITAQDELLFREDNSLVFTIIDGELETPEDYYFLKVQIEHNKNYEFGYKTVYRELKNQTVVNDWHINYGQGLNDPNDLYVYFLRMENVDGQVVYMEVHCFENNLSYIFNEFI